MSFVAERRGESSCIEVSAPRTIFVDDAVVREFRSAVLIQFRQPSHGDVLQNHGQQVVGIRRAAGKIDDWFSRNHGVNANRAGRIRIGGRNSAPGSTGPYGDHSRGLRGDFFDDLNGGLSTQLHVNAVVLGGNRTFDHENVFASIVLDGRAQSRFGLRARSGHQRLVIVERDYVENQMADVGSGGSQQGFRAAGAILKVQPDDGGSARLAHDSRHLRGGGLAGQTQADRRSHNQGGTEL